MLTNSWCMSRQQFTVQVIKLIQTIPKGKVATYGGIAAMAGAPRAARQVARILHSCSEKERLPWHRVVNKAGRIALRTDWDRAEQEDRLEREGIVFDASGRINLSCFGWSPEKKASHTQGLGGSCV